MNFKRRIAYGETGFQMGPMLDIIFILLIQFMVATMFANSEDWFNVNVPVAANGHESQELISEIVLNLRTDGTLMLYKGFSDDAGGSSAGETLVTPADWLPSGGGARPGGLVRLQSKLQFFNQHNPHLKVIIRADEQAAHGKVVGVLDVCAGLGIRNVAFATQKPLQ